MRKMVYVYLFICCYLLAYFVPCNGQTGTDLKDLLTELFTTRTYRTDVRPNADLSNPMTVLIDFYLSGITEIDEITQTLTTTGYLEVIWEDEHLMWDPSSYGGLETVYVPQNNIWKPDLTLRNGVTKLNELGSSFINAKLSSTGYIVWKPVEVFHSKCTIDVKYFPFDRQKCQLIFVAWSSTVEWINATRGASGIFLDNLEENGEWRIVSTSGSEDMTNEESAVTFNLVLEKSSYYYVMNIIIPVVLLSILNVFTFVLPADSGEKMGYSITVFLSFAVFLTIVSSELPKTSGSILGTYLMFQIVLGTFVVCLTSLELRFHHRSEPVPSKIVGFFNYQKRCKKITDSNQIEEGDRNKTITDSNQAEEKEISSGLAWSDVISKLDFFLFWILLFAVAIVTIGVFGYLSLIY